MFIEQFCAQDMTGLLHELVTVAATLKNPWFEAAAAVGDFTFGVPFEHRAAIRGDRRGRDQATGEQRPRRQHKLAGTGKTDLTRLLVVQQGRVPICSSPTLSR